MEKELTFKTPLHKWLWLHRVKQSDFARSLGITRQRMNGLVQGRLGCGKKYAARISELTGGGVTEIELLYPERIDRSQLTVTISPDACQ